MGIHSKFEGASFTAIDLAGMADDMLAQVVADHAAMRFQAGARANRKAAGVPVPYAVAVNGRAVARGTGEIFPRQQVQRAIAPNVPAGRAPRPVIVVDWHWETLPDSALRRAIETIARIHTGFVRLEEAATFARLLLNARDDTAAMLRYLLLRYAYRRYPEIFRRLDQARALYRVYRLVHLGAGIIGGDADRKLRGDVLAWVARELRSRSPVLSGAYRDAHALWGDGRFIMEASAVTTDAEVPDANEYAFTNTAPYARKIEVGRTAAGRDFVIQVQNRIYERVADDARNAFRGRADIAFEWRAVIDAHQTPQRFAWYPHNKSDVRYPAIVVTF